MKKIFVFVMSLATVAMTFVSCQKSGIDIVYPEGGIEVTIHTGAGTKTMIDGETPYWCDGDAIGVSTAEKDNNTKFLENSIADGEHAATATFTGKVASTGTYYAYYPYTSNGVSASGAKVDIPSTQHPTATSFDGSADVMVSKPFEISSTSATTVEGLSFARLGAVVKVVLKDESETYDLSAEKPVSVTLTAESNLVGRVYVKMNPASLGDLYYGGKKSVTAEYSDEDQFTINGTNTAYFVVYPQTLEAGTTLNVSAETGSYSISKDINVPEGGIVFKSGVATVLNVSLSDSDVAPTVVPSGAALPFLDDMSWADNGTSDNGTDLADNISEASAGLYTSSTKAYKGKGGLKLGTGSATGSVTTKALDLSGAFNIAVTTGQYGSDTGKLIVKVDDDTVISGSEFGGVQYVNIDAGTYTSTSKVTIATSSKRGYIYNVSIQEGEYIAPPVINVTSANPMDVTNENDLYAIEYSIENPVAGKSVSAVSNVDWIHDFDYSVAGEIAFEVDAQESGAAEREGTITLSYDDADDVVVTVNQAAGEGWADTEHVVYTLTPANGSNNSYNGSCDITIDGITWNLTGNSTINPWRIGGKSITNTDRALYSKTALNYNISKIEITHGDASNITVNSMTVIVASDANFNNVVSTLTPAFTANGTVTVERPDGNDWSNCYYKFVYKVTVSGSSNRFLEFKEAVFTGK